MTDILDWFAPPPGQHMAGNSNPVWTLVTPADSRGHGRIWWLKSSAGNVWDVMPYDDLYVYLWATEIPSSWTDTTGASYKAFLDPIPFVERQVKRGTPGMPYSSSQSTYQFFVNCHSQTPQGQPMPTVGDVRTQLVGPFTLDHGGDVGSQPTLVVSYQWNGLRSTFGKREQFYLCRGYGLVRWDTSNLDPVSGMYVEQQQVVFNTLAVGAAPTPVAACF